MSLAVSSTYTLLVHVMVHTCTLMETFHYYSYCLHHDCVFRLRSVYCIMSTVVCSTQGGDANHLCTTTHTYTHKHTCYRFNYLTSVLTDIDLCKRCPWGRWSYTYLPPPALPLQPLSLILESYSMSFGEKKGRIPPDLLLTTCQYRDCQHMIDVLHISMCMKEPHIMASHLSLSLFLLRHTHELNRHIYTHSVMCNFPV